MSMRPIRTTPATPEQTQASLIRAARPARARTPSCRCRAMAVRPGPRRGRSHPRRHARTIRRSSWTPRTGAPCTQRSCRTTSRASTSRVRTTTATRGGRCSSSRFSAEPTRTSSPHGADTCTSSTTPSRRSSPRSRTTAARPGRYTISSARRTPTWVCLYRAVARSTRRGTPISPGTAPTIPARQRARRISTSRVRPTAAPRGRRRSSTSRSRCSRAAVPGGTTGARRWRSESTARTGSTCCGTPPTRAPESSACTCPF